MTVKKKKPLNYQGFLFSLSIGEKRCLNFTENYEIYIERGGKGMLIFCLGMYFQLLHSVRRKKE